MIKISRQDTIVDIVQKIDDSKEKDIVLDFPTGHPILHNQLSLKIIKNKAGKRKLLILSSDLTSRKIGKNLGIKYSIIKDKKFIEEGQKSEDLMKHNFTFFEYLSFEVKHLYQNILTSLARNKNISSINKYYNKYNKAYNMSWFFWGLAISLVLLIFIFYFAVNKTYIHVTPEIVVKSRARNFVFKGKPNEITTENDVSYISNISKDIYLEKKFSTTGVDLGSIQRSKGTALFFNETEQEQQILEGTTARTQEGLLFTTLSWAIIPPATQDNFGNIIPGNTEVEIESEIYDINGKFIGKRGNIEKDTKLTIPGLGEYIDNIYLQTQENIKGGKDSYKKILSEVDISNATSIMEEKLKSTAIKELSQLVKDENIINKTDVEIFGIDDMIVYSDPEITIKGNTSTGTTVETFSLNGNITASTYTYDKTNIINRLKNVIRDSILEGTEKIIYIDTDSLRISNVIYKRDDPLEIKATSEIEVLISHDFLDQSNNYVEKLKNTIKGLDKKEAFTLLLNDPKISNVEIKVRPFFIKKISNINENIIFKVEE